MSKIQNNLFQNYSTKTFLSKAQEIFKFQYQYNPIYHKFCQYLNRHPHHIQQLTDIPFIPVNFFKHHIIKTTAYTEECMFTSSCTSSDIPSKHYIKDCSLYTRNLIRSFEFFYGPITQYEILPLLPSYAERKNSSLVYMIDQLMNMTEQEDKSYYLYNHQDLYERLLSCQKQNHHKIIIFGVSFALLDFLEKYTISFPELIVFETGGMKGRREEMIKSELHRKLKSGFGVSHIHSEYGMTELLSQAYSQGNSLFLTPPWQKILIRDQRDPLSFLPEEHRGNINIIDFGNLWSCSFIATDDIGIIHKDGSFEILGRTDLSDIRGCNLMVSDLSDDFSGQHNH